MMVMWSLMSLDVELTDILFVSVLSLFLSLSGGDSSVVRAPDS